MKSIRMGGACSILQIAENVYKTVDSKPEGKIALGKTRHVREYTR
jgi:hypothetical protein